MLKKLFLISCLLLSVTATHAALIDYGSITYDDVTRLAWLDTTRFVGQSYNTVESQMREGALYEGYRHATKSEVSEIFIQLELPFGYNGPTLSGIDTLVDLFGDTATSSDDVSGVFALSAPEGTGNGPATIGFAFNRQNLGTSEVIFNGYYGRNLSSAEIGHWVIMNEFTPPIPIPPAIWLFGSGLIALAGITRKRKVT